ncbi:MAG: hypothetical protein SOX77_03290 [Candidatus Borkfalkiaceae bacterium]|nr:hypothetical protein [Christensenellaceae bacterium]
MKKILTIIIVILAILAFVGCDNSSANSSSGNNESNNQSENNESENQSGEQSEKVFEGEMLLNGFDTVDDLYAVKQIDTKNADGGYNIWTSTGKLDIVGEKDFLFADTQTKIDNVISLINGLPDAASINEPTDVLRSSVSKARSLYTSLTSSGKEKVTNSAKLEAVIDKLGMKGVYTLGELVKNSCKRDLTQGMKSVSGWTSACADLVDGKEGKIVFTAKGLCDNAGSMPNHALQITLFHDHETNDGLYMRVATDDDTIHFRNSKYNIPLNAKLDRTCLYTFEIFYKVADDYSKLTLGVKIIDDLGQYVCNETRAITDFNASNTGDVTIEEWLTGERKSIRKSFLLDSGTTDGLTVDGLWKGYSIYEDNEYKDYNISDLSPRQGDGALRINYLNGSNYSYLYSNFNASRLAGLPSDKLGGMSVKVFNNNPEKQTVKFSIMRDYGNFIDLDDATFELAPYQWTTCAMSFDPNIIKVYANDIVGVNLYFDGRMNTVYYVDDWRVSFDMIETQEQAANKQALENLRSDINTLSAKTITINDATAVKSVYERYIALSSLNKDMIGAEEKLHDIFKAYNQAVYEKDISDGKSEFSLLPLDDYLGMIGISEGTDCPEYVTYTTDVKSPNGAGSIKVDISHEKITNGISISLADGIFDELHVWVKNDSDSSRYVRLSSNMLRDYNGTAYDEDGNEVLGTYVDKNNTIVSKNVYDGWICLVYRNFVMAKNIITQQGSGALYIGRIYGVSHQQEVIDAIAALPSYSAGYTAAQRAKVKEVRAKYDALGDLTKDRINNKSKLFEIQAQLWKEEYNSLNLPSDVSGLSYNESTHEKVNSLVKEYLGFDYSGQKLITTEYNKLTQTKARFEEFVEANRNNVYTLKDIGVAESGLGMWISTTYTIPEKTSATYMFTVTHRALSGTGVFYITLFYEQCFDKDSNYGKGLAYTFQSHRVDCQGVSGVSFAEPMDIDVPYFISISYALAADGNSINAILCIERADNGYRLAELTNTLTTINGVKDGQTIEDWIKSHKTMYIQAGQCSIDKIGNAWEDLSATKLQEVQRINNAITNLSDASDITTLDELNSDLNALPQVYRLMVKNAEALQAKIDKYYASLRDYAYTLNEFGLPDGNISSWVEKKLDLKNEMQGKIIFRRTSGEGGTQVHYLKLLGYTWTFQINSYKVNWGDGTNSAMENIQPYTDYYCVVGYKVADDYSKIDVSLWMEAVDGGAVIAKVSHTYTAGLNGATIREQVKANKTFIISSGQVSFTYASAWKQFDNEKLKVVNKLEEDIAALNGSEQLSVLDALKATYESLERPYQFLVDNYDVLESIYGAIARVGVYTTGEIGIANSAILGQGGAWTGVTGTLKTEMSGTIVFRMTKKDNGGIYTWITLFHSTGTANSGDGFVLTFNRNNNLNLTNDTPYIFRVSYKVADDYSKVTVRVLILSENDGSIFADITNNYTTITGSSDTIENWVKAHKEFRIYSGGIRYELSSAWTTFDTEKFEEVKALNAAISGLTGSETAETLNGLKARYDALPVVYRNIVDDVAKLNAAIAAL